MKQKTKILVVEDERIVAEDVKRSLLNLGYEVTGMASSGEEALEEVEKHMPDLVLMDIVLQGPLNGIGTTERLRAQYDIPVIYLTAHADPKTLERAKLTEPFGYILKPFDDRELQSAIEMALYKHQIESKLKKSEAWFSTTLKSIGEGVIVTDREECVTFMNHAAEGMTGRTQDEALGNPLEGVFKILHEKTGERVENPARRVLKERSVVGLNNETAVETKDGGKVPIDYNAAPIKDGRGELVGVVVVFHDIIERRMTEEALKESEERYRSLFEESRDAIYITTRKGRFVIANQSTLDLFGFSTEEMLRLNIGDLYVHAEERKNFQEEIEREGSVRDYEIKLRNKKGTELDCLLTSTVRKDKFGTILRYQGIIRDITERKLAEEALRKSEARYRLLAENVTDIIWVMDLNLKFTYITPSITHMLGYSVEEAMQIKLDALLTPASYSLAMKVFSEEFMNEKAEGADLLRSRSLELELICKDGSNVWVDVSMTLLREPDGRATGILGAAHDVTARKRVEAEREKIQAQLLQAQKIEAVGILAGGIAHDFNNLLTVIQGNTDLAMMKVDEEDSLYSDLAEVQAAAIRAANLTSQLLLFSRKQPMQFNSVDINKTVEDLLKLLHRLIGEDISVSTDLEEELWSVWADRGTLDQVIMNICVNARDAMPQGGRMTIKTRNVILDENACKMMAEAVPGTCVCLSVSDTGIGMDEDTIRHVFEPFFSTKGAGKGTGLGLSVVYGIARQHNGWIHVKSEPDHGSVFEVYFPAASNKMNGKTAEVESVMEFRGCGERVLVVEDEEGVREFSAAALEGNGYTVFTAGTAEEAMLVFQLEKGDFDVVLCDVVLPDRNGVQLVDEILAAKPELSVLLCSGYTGLKSQRSVIQERGFRFMQKPFALFDLLKTLKEVLSSNGRK